MRSANIAFCLFLSIIVCMLYFVHKSYANKEQHIIIGFNYPKTGPYKEEGLDQLRGAKLALEEINNDEGILGKTIDFEIRDTESNPDEAAKKAGKLYGDGDKDNGAKMIFGGASSAVAVAVGKVAHEKNKLFFATLSYSMDTTGKDGYRTTFRETYDSWMAAQALGSYFQKNNKFKGKTYYYITSDYTWGWTTEAALRLHTDTTDTKKHKRFKTPLGGKEKKFVTAIRKAKEENPDVLVLVLFGNDFIKAMDAVGHIGLKDNITIVVPNLTLAMVEKATQGAGSKFVKGIIGAVPWEWQIVEWEKKQHPEKYQHNGEAFIKKFLKKYNRYPSSSAASAYNILYEYKRAVEAAKDFDETDNIISILEGHCYKGLKEEKQCWRGFDHQSVQSVFVVECNSKDEAETGDTKHGLAYFKILDKVSDIDNDLKGEGTVAVPKILWIWQRLMTGKSSQLD